MLICTLLHCCCIEISVIILQVPKEKRINRATSSIFRFTDGCIGNLSHSLVLHEDTYHTAFEILADGLQIIIEDPYGVGSVTVRRPHSREYEKVSIGYSISCCESLLNVRQATDCFASWTTVLAEPMSDKKFRFKAYHAGLQETVILPRYQKQCWRAGNSFWIHQYILKSLALYVMLIVAEGHRNRPISAGHSAGFQPSWS